MVFDYEKGIPKGRIIPVYLTDEGDVYSISFPGMEELELCEEMVGVILNHTVAVNLEHPINEPEYRIYIINRSNRKT